MISTSFFQDKKVFITGHTGFKGSWLTQILVLLGANVTGYALPVSEEKSLFSLLDFKNSITSYFDDIRNLEKLKNAVQKTNPDIIMHLAAQPLVKQSYDDPVMTYETNVLGTVNALEAMRTCESVRSFLNVTTDKVYENKEWHWGYRENENLCGYDPYSNSKSCSELVTYSYKKSFFSNDKAPSISTARSGNVIGGGDFAKDRIVPDCFKAIEDKKEICIRNPNSVRPYQHVLECLSGYLLLVEKQYSDKAFEGSYNFGPNDDSCVTTGDLTSLICKYWGEGAFWKSQQVSGPHEANLLKLDNTKAKTILGWKPLWNIETAIEKTVEWNKALQEKKSITEITKNQIMEYFNI